MATPLDLGLLKQFEGIFPFIFILVMCFVIFNSAIPFFKNSKTMAGIAAFAVAVMTMFSPIATGAIQNAAPWVIVVSIFFIFTLLGLYTLGIEEADVTGVLRSDRWGFISILIVIIFLVIALASLGKSVTDQGGFGIAPTEGQEADFYNTVFHPKILGMIFVLLMAFFTINILSRKTDWG